MPATINNLPYPAGTDKVADGDNAIRALAEAMRVWSARVAIPAPTGGALYRDVAVVFPAGLFTASPVVVVTGVTNTSGTAIVVSIASNGNITKDGCTIRAVLSTGATWGQAYTAQLIAAQIG